MLGCKYIHCAVMKLCTNQRSINGPFWYAKKKSQAELPGGLFSNLKIQICVNFGGFKIGKC
jgi:hypothetical protein